MNAFLLGLILIGQLPEADGSLASDELTTSQSSGLTPDHRPPARRDSEALTPDQQVSCGVGAAYLLLQRLGQSVTIEEIEAASPVAADGPMSLAELQQLFANLGFPAEGYRMPLERVDRPVIAYLPHPDGKVGHFVVVEPAGNQGSGFGVQGSDLSSQSSEVSGSQPSTLDSKPSSGSPPSALSPQLFLILDPLAPPLKVPADVVRKAWDGRVLVVYPKGTRVPSRAVLAPTLWPVIAGASVALLSLGLAVSFLLSRRALPGLCEDARSCDTNPKRQQGPKHSGILNPTSLTLRVCVAAVGVLAALGVGGFHVYSRRAADSPVTDHRSPITAEPVPVRVALGDIGTTLLLPEGTNFDLGQVKLGEKLSHTFRVKNLGRQDLPLEKLKMNCACNAQVAYERDVLRPGETAGITVSMTAVGYGSQTKPIPFAIARDGEVQTLFTLNLHYRVAWIEQLTFLPGHLEMGQLSCTAETAKGEVQLVLVGPPDEPDPELLDVTRDTEAITVSVLRREAPQVNTRTAQMIPAKRVIYWLELEVHPQDLALGLFHEHITASTSIGEAKLGIKGEVCRPITATPASLLVDASRPQATRHVIRLKSVAGERVQIRSAECESSGVICRLVSDRQQVEVEIAPEAKLNRDAAVEIVAQAGESFQTLRVPLIEL